MIPLAIAAGVAVLMMLVMLIWRPDPARERLDELSQEPVGPSIRASDSRVRVVVPTAVGAAAAGQRAARAERTKPTLRERMIQAGLYRLQGPGAVATVRIASVLVPVVAAVVLAWTGTISARHALLLGGSVAGVGAIAPTFLLDYLKSRRQTQMRRSLPDALDTIVVCLEGGLSLTTAFSRVASELAGAHPMLALELKIVEREVQMGLKTGDAMRSLARRFDLEELRSMATVITHAERYGASVGTALSVYADSLRLQRAQHAEEAAHKAAVKVMFPTALCILPALFIVILGPAAVQISRVLLPLIDKMAK